MKSSSMMENADKQNLSWLHKKYMKETKPLRGEGWEYV
jgi:hypothetical protein